MRILLLLLACAGGGGRHQPDLMCALHSGRLVHLNQLAVDLLCILLLSIHSILHREHMIDRCDRLRVKILLLCLLSCEHFLALLMRLLSTLVVVFLDIIRAFAETL